VNQSVPARSHVILKGKLIICAAPNGKPVGDLYACAILLLKPNFHLLLPRNAEWNAGARYVPVLV
jgi:hypothetical protein